jgi:uncharacterized protein (TIGR04255 family)
MTAEDHEIYPHAPVALVTIEITFPGQIGTAVPAGVQRAIGDVLGDEWVPEPVVQTGLALNLSGPQPLMPQPPNFPNSTILRFADRERGSAVALTAGSVSVETTRYRNWPQFRSTLEVAVRATEKLLRPAGVTRAGVRYIDEVRVPGVEGAGWNEWLSPTVLPPGFDSMVGAGWPPVNWTGAAQYRLSEDRYLVLRYGPQAAQPGFVVNPDGPLRRPGPRPEGPFFMLDFDASWQPAVVPRWDSDALLETCDQLRHPVRALFDGIVTDGLVKGAFKKEGDE